MSKFVKNENMMKNCGNVRFWPKSGRRKIWRIFALGWKFKICEVFKEIIIVWEGMWDVDGKCELLTKKCQILMENVELLKKKCEILMENVIFWRRNVRIWWQMWIVDEQMLDCYGKYEFLTKKWQILMELRWFFDEEMLDFDGQCEFLTSGKCGI